MVQACFGKTLLSVPDSSGKLKSFEELIFDFHQAYLKLRISVTPKVHALVVHVPQWCHRNGVGLGSVSEQASESVHFDFGKKWELFKLHEDNKRFPQKLRDCVVSYNSSHL